MSVEILPDGTLVLKEQVKLPDVLDLLIVGGGPAGTAAAFRAKELGLAALVIDYDDLLKRIRDYSKDKLILPSFGGGDKMKFPKGGSLIAHLHFAPIDKDEMCIHWKTLYRDFSVPARLGIELTALERQADGIWIGRAWNQKTSSEETFRARHVVVAMGRGVPRRFDIPGNTDGIAYRLDDAERYVGVPACVIGGGTSAAEAVIAISHAKAYQGDPSAVYWSYRGDKMPKVSKALSDVFFDAFVGNGNIFYCPRSEPVAVVTGPDRNDYLSVRIDRKAVDSRPSETSHLEFTKTSCIACIGEDLPTKFLDGIGIHMMTGGPNMKKRVVVSPLLESRQPNIYLIGDLLSQAYLETDDFDGDPASFREVKHRGNIKSALRDGVFVAEVVKQKLEGRSVIQVELDFEDGPSEKTDKKGGTLSDSLIRNAVEMQGPPDATVSEERVIQENVPVLVQVTPTGIDEEEIALDTDGITTIGRKNCDITFPEDLALSDNHASIVQSEDGYFLRDDGSTTGTFLQLPPGQFRTISNGDLIRLGRQFLLFDYEGNAAFFDHYNAMGEVVGRHPVPQKTMLLGRQAPDLTLDAQDMSLSRRHLSLAFKDGQVQARDLGSVNGSYLRVRTVVPLQHGDIFRVGRQRFRLSLSPEEEMPQKVSAPAPSRPEPVARQPVSPPSPAGQPAAQPSAQPASAPAGKPMVTFEGLGKSFDVPPGKTICDIAEQNGLALDADCHAGICGSDPIRIISGGEFLNPMRGQEEDSLEDICELEGGNQSGKCRLACMAKVTGPVVVEIL